MTPDSDWLDTDHAWVLEEIRNETVLKSLCNCKPGDPHSNDPDEDPCEHGYNEEIAYQTEAEWAKEQLKDWTYEDDILLIAEEGEYEREEGEGPPTFLLNLSAVGGVANPTEEDLDTGEEEWYFNEDTNEWEVR